jgi:hypothetical protein
MNQNYFGSSIDSKTINWPSCSGPTEPEKAQTCSGVTPIQI